MSEATNPTTGTCGCGQGPGPLTPQSLENLPGLSALAYRVGTQGSFKETMLTSLTERRGLDKLTIRDDDDPSIALMDASAVVLDVLTFYQERIINEGYLRTAVERRSVLELARQIGYELAPGVAASTYLAFTLENAPGVPLGSVPIPIGTRVQSLPGPDQTPQLFEMVEAITARAAWNEMTLKVRELVKPGFNEDEIYLRGTSTNLKAGDALLIVGRERLDDPSNENWDFRRVKSVTPVNVTDSEKSYTLITLEYGLGSFEPFKMPARDDPRVYVLRQRANLFGHNAPDWKGLTKKVRQDYLGLSSEDELSEYPDWPDLTIASVSDEPDDDVSGTGLYGVYFNDHPYDGHHFKIRKLARTDAQIDFAWGSSSPVPGKLPANKFSVRWTGWIQPKVSGVHTFTARADDGIRLWVNNKLVINSWQDQAATDRTGPIRLEAGKKYDIKLEYYEHGGLAEIRLYWMAEDQLSQEIVPTACLYPRDIHTIYLDLAYPLVRPGGWVVLSRDRYQEVYRIEESVEDARACLTMSGKSTRLVLEGEHLHEKFDDQLRETVVFCQSEELRWAEKPITRPLSGDTLMLDGSFEGLAPNRTLIVSGKRARVRGRRSGSLLHRPDGSHLEVERGESSVLSRAPATLVSGKLRWTLSKDDHQSGTVDAAESHFAFLPAAEWDERVSEVVTIKSVSAGAETTCIVLEQPLAYLLDPATVIVYGNVALATHGETRTEVLGSGDASRAFPKVHLRNSPLTYISAASATGSRSTLEVRVDDVQWNEVDSFLGLGKRQRAYLTRRDDEGKVTVEFGDGETGARPPTGEENIRAVYRVGTGAGGMVDVGQLSLLMSQILGVRKVTNPLAPSGAADPESRDQARENAPFTVRTLGRVVSLQDFEDFARAFAGIGKAQAEWLWDGEARVVHLTVAASVPCGGDHRVVSNIKLYENLRGGIDAARDTTQRLLLDTYRPLFFRLNARVRVRAEHLVPRVVQSVRVALEDAYRFEKRLFGQSVTRGELLALIQGVAGVEATFLDSLYLTGQAAAPADALPARRAGFEGNQVQPAELLLIDPAGITVEAFPA